MHACIIKYVRNKYKKSKHVWSRFGFALDFDPIGRIDVNIVPPNVYDESWERDAIKINDVNVFLPPLEDILIMSASLLFFTYPKDFAFGNW